MSFELLSEKYVHSIDIQEYFYGIFVLNLFSAVSSTELKNAWHNLVSRFSAFQISLTSMGFHDSEWGEKILISKAPPSH